MKEEQFNQVWQLAINCLKEESSNKFIDHKYKKAKCLRKFALYMENGQQKAFQEFKEQSAANGK